MYLKSKKSLSGTMLVLFLTILFMLAFFTIFYKLFNMHNLQRIEQNQLIIAKFHSLDTLLVYLRSPAIEEMPFVEFIDVAYHNPSKWTLLKTKTLEFFQDTCFTLTIVDKTIEQGSCDTIKLSTVIPSVHAPTKPLVVTLEIQKNKKE